MTEIVAIHEWSAPPMTASERVRTVYDDILDELKSNPGEWALVARGATASQVSSIRAQLKTRRGCQVNQTKTGVDEHDVRARWARR